LQPGVKHLVCMARKKHPDPSNSYTVILLAMDGLR
jgi:hypothetical protein